MEETNIQEILKYYLEYEIYNIANSSKIKVDDKKSILLNDLSNFKYINKNVNKLKKIKISQKIENFIGKKIKNKEEIVNQIIDELMELDEEQANKNEISLIIKNLIHENMRYEKEDKKIEKFVDNLCDIHASKEFFIYAHNITILHKNNSKNSKKMPIFILKCCMKPNNIKVTEVNVSTETLNAIISVILNKEISEVALQYEEAISDYCTEIKTLIDAGDIEHLLELYYSRLEKYTDISRDAIENIEKMKSSYKMNEEYIISIDELAEDGIKKIKEDIETLTKLVNDDGYIPTVLRKYLNGNENKKDINDSKYVKMYRGNYKSDYGINENQYKIVNSVKDNELIAIEGPPGTGKTSLLKEIIANNIVERSELILKNWDKNFEQNIFHGTNYYNINWYNENDNIIKSIVVSSKNGEAIENVSNDINKEIRYMFPIARKYIRTEKTENSRIKNEHKYKGLVCLPLGKQDNMQDFRDFLYQQYIPMLEKASSKKHLDKYIDKIKKKYEDKIKEIKIIERSIRTLEKYVNRQKYFYGIQISKEDDEEQKTMKIEQIKNKLLEDKEQKQGDFKEIEIEKDRAQKQIEEYEKQQEDIKIQINNKDKQIENSQKIITEGKNSIQELKTRKQRFENISKNIITILLNYKEYKRDKNFNFISEINRLTTINETEDKKIFQYINEKSKLENKEIKLKEQYEEVKELYGEAEAKYKILDREIKEIKLIEKFNQWDKKTYWNYLSDLEIYGNSSLNNLNQELFYLALKLNEAYILKNSSEIIENLKLFLSYETSFVCQKFYDSTEIYSAEKQDGIRCLWNTLFLCFPVVTTTLDSFSKRCFHLIPEYIDLELIDEAGQILTHNLVSAIYRTKKAVIVGDVNQIEPIYSKLSKDFSKNQKVIGERFESVKIPENSTQALANKNTDILDCNENIILNNHYRCEKNIINFSNEYVYENKLNLHKKDGENKPFLSNMVALDVRGKKENGCYLNKLEIDSCIETIKYIKDNTEKEGEEPSIAVITPFKKQREELEDRLKKEGFKNIKVGTVHAFQGQERDYIIFSQVIDSLEPRSIVNFIGKKCNMLNVAVTRAKKQFIYLGNLDLAMKAKNYMSKLINYINKNGLKYSLYDIENTALTNNWDERILHILEPVLELDNDNIGLYISQHSEKGMMKDAKQHYELLKYAIKNAKSEICIMAPWLRSNVINDEFLNDIKKLKENNCVIKIAYGFKKVNTKTSSVEELVTNLKNARGLGYASKEEVVEIIEQMYKIIGKENFICNCPTHAKVFIIDGKYMFIGSHNWLSNAGATEESDRAMESTIITTNKSSIDYSREQYFKQIT